MYCDFYRLRERPFNVTADPKFLYLNARYREALASLHYGISQRKGFITLIGEAGTGKTTLLKKLLDDLDATTRTVFIFNTNVSFDEILEYIFGEFDLPVHNGKRLYMLQRLNVFLLEELRNGRNVALLIDEAQDLDFSVLEDLRLLSNLETAKEKILQIVLSGQPELGQKLGNPGLRQLRQRVAVNCRLLPLTRDEVSEYIQSRLTAAGSADPKIFTRDAEDRIFEISSGIPRLVNIVCDNALVIGYALGKKRIGADVVNEAAADLLSIESTQGPAAPAAEEPVVVETPVRRRSRTQPAIVAGVALATVVGLFSVGRSLLDRERPGGAESTAGAPLEVIPPGSRSAGERPVLKPPAEPPAAQHQLAAVEAASDVQAAMVPSGGEVAPLEEPAVAVAPPVPERVEVGPPRAEERAAPAVAARLPAIDPAAAAAARTVAEADPRRASDERPAEPVARPIAEPPPVENAPVERAAANVAPPPAPEPPRDRGAEALAAAAPLVAAPAAEPARATLPEEEPARDRDGVELAMSSYQTVRVQPGDSVSEIAVRNYGQASPTILDMMKIANPSIRDIDVISIGQELRLPQLDEGFVILRQKGGYALLLISTPLQQRANEIEGALRERGFQARVRRADFGSGRLVNRVIIGNLNTRDEALDVGKRLQRLFREDERIAAMAR